jgi:hypothetical protein
MENVIYWIFMIVCMIVLFIMVPFYERYQRLLYKERVGWQICEKPYRILEDLQFKVDRQKIFTCPCFIYGDEVTIACNIIKAFQDNLKPVFLAVSSHEKWKILKISDFDDFIYRLAIYLDKYKDMSLTSYVECSDLHIEWSSDGKAINYDDIKLQRLERELVYWKLVYMCEIYCEKNSIPKKDSHYLTEKAKDILEKKQAEFLNIKK